MIEFKNVKKSFGKTDVLKGINLKINKGELVVLIGHSGCGKTTTLKMINRLIKKTSGDICIDGKDINDVNEIELRRNIGYVIQQTGLFPHMTVGENISIVPKLKKWSEDKTKKRVLEMLDMIGMESHEYMYRYPNELSGGQKQRIGVARAFATNPEIILMDEPFSALDPITRNQLQDELFNLQQKLKKTIVFVTHDMDEALKLADKICIMHEGRILQYDTPETILKSPVNDFVEEFIGKNRIWSNPEYIKSEDIMIKDPVKTSGNRTLVQAVEIMKTRKVDSLLIVDDTDKLKGIVTSKDIRMNIDKNLRIADIMKKNIITVNKDESIIKVLNLINNLHIGYIPIVDYDKKLVGLITQSSLISVLSTQFIDMEVGA